MAAKQFVTVRIKHFVANKLGSEFAVFNCFNVHLNFTRCDELQGVVAMKKNPSKILIGATLSIALAAFSLNAFAQEAGGSSGSMEGGSSGPVAGSVPGPAGSDVPNNPGIGARNPSGGANNTDNGSSMSPGSAMNPSTSPSGANAGSGDTMGNSATTQEPNGRPSMAPPPISNN